MSPMSPPAPLDPQEDTVPAAAHPAGSTDAGDDGFVLTYDGFDAEEEGLREALTSTGNGYFCTRGAAEWEDTDAPTHYAGTYAHGAFNRETTILGGRPVPNEDLVNLPNWLVLKLRIEGEEAITLDNVEVLGYRHTYDIRTATVAREFRFRDRAGRETTLHSRRFVSMAHSHQAAIEWTLTPENWSGRIGVVSAIDGRVDNDMVARYRDLEGRHLDPVTPRTFGPEVIALKVRTRQSNLYISEAARTRVFRGRGRGWERMDPPRELHQMNDYIQHVLHLDVHEGETIKVEKMVAFFTSHDNAITETLAATGRHVERYPDFAGARLEHEAAWTELWDVCDVALPSEPRVEMLLRFHTAHVLQVCSRHTARHDAGVPARGLNGEAYRGHVFWDELYVYPFLNFRLPEITRGLLMYRYRRLAEARVMAAEAGYAGAMFPWQSGTDGTEETQVVHLNPLSGQWDPDHSHNQRHVNAAIFYNVWQYYQVTDDLEFLRGYGAEILLEITRFWASIAHKDQRTGRYEIHGVMGPDEFHERYPGAEQGGLRNNAYTNVMVAWITATAPRVLALMPASRRRALRERLGITDAELERWSEMSTSMFVPTHTTEDGHRVITQFEGYEDLEELDWEHYRSTHDNIQRLDRILKAEGDDPDRYKLAKQADAVMLFFLFPDTELREIFSRLGYQEIADDAEMARRTVDYYDERTSHGSTLSLVAHAAVLAGLDPASSWDRFLVALESDVGDVQGGTTKEGIHMGVMSGTLDLLQRAYAGCSVRDGVLTVAPRVTDRLDGLSFPIVFQGTSLRVSVAAGELTVAVDTDGFSHPIQVSLGGEMRVMEAGDRRSVPLHGTDELPGRETHGAQVLVAGERKGGHMSEGSNGQGYRGGIFDVDGVLVDSPHEQAWRESLRELMEGDWSDIAGQTSWTPEAFTSDLYHQRMSGKPRNAGATAALEYFGVPDVERRVTQYGEHKQEMIVRLIDEGRFSAYDDAVRFVLAVKAAGIGVAAASSSKNAGLFLSRIDLGRFGASGTLRDAFDVDVSGRDFSRGKPDPEIFLTAASELGLDPGDTFVVEDATNGVQAAKAGRFGAIGVARADDSDALAAEGADLVVTSLDTVDVDRLGAHDLSSRS